MLYIMANFALTAYIRREHPDDFSIWRHGVLPWIGTLALLPVLWVTVYPVPPWPYRITPYIFLLTLIAGVGYMQWRERRNPGRAEARRDDAGRPRRLTPRATWTGTHQRQRRRRPTRDPAAAAG